MNREELLAFLDEGLGICGCSDGDMATEFLFDLLEAGEMHDAGLHAEAAELLSDMLPEDDCFARNLPVYWLTAAGLTEHGYSLMTYGLSELGEAVLEALRTYGSGEELWEQEHAPVAANRTLN